MSVGDEVVVTGLGIVSPIGVGRDAFWESLVLSRSGVASVEPLTALPQRRWLAARVNEFDPHRYVFPRKTLKVMSREMQFGFAAARMALEHAAWQPGQIDPNRVGVSFGSEVILSEWDDLLRVLRAGAAFGSFDVQRWSDLAFSEIFPLWMLKSLPNMAACHVGNFMDARGPNNTFASDETSGLLAVCEAAATIERGAADLILVGASGDRTCPTRLLQRWERLYCQAAETPGEACRPFDAGRSGTVPGQGSAALVLERRSAAERRGAPLLARIAGWGSRFGGPAVPLSGSAAAVAGALQQAVLGPAGPTGRAERKQFEAIGHLNSGALGAVVNDATEAMGIRLAGLADCPTVAYKGLLGECGAASGLLELVASLLAVEQAQLPPTANHRSRSEDCSIHVHADGLLQLDNLGFLKLSVTPHGQAVAARFLPP
jgi:3-oxoacyl-[acyl-carrier-protein] synthase II